jgi:uncharacterized protein (TIGR00730 family)
MRISVFGSSRVQPGTQDYEDTVAVGAALAKAGYTVLTGGYGGLMEAASRGANEAGGHVIGATTPQIEAIRPGASANPWVLEEVRCEKLSERLEYLIQNADGYVVMPGGVGTLNELVLAWEYMRVGEIPVRPLVCFGKIWRETLAAFIDSRYIPEHHQGMVTFIDSAEQAVAALKKG